MPRTKESGIVNGYQLALLGRRVLALEAERDALREALNSVVDEGVVNWHNASDDTRHVHEALGLTFEQYAAWVERDWPKFVKACPS